VDFQPKKKGRSAMTDSWQHLRECVGECLGVGIEFHADLLVAG
jgi:hypothetical protein